MHNVVREHLVLSQAGDAAPCVTGMHAQGAFGLPFGLLMVLICGGELFTGNTALVTAAVRLAVTSLHLALCDATS